MRTHFTKLEGFCIGPFMTGVKPRSGDFVLWEMLDQHIILARALDLDDWLGECPKLATLHSSMRALPELADYFAAPCYAEWSHNSPAYTHFTGHGDMDQGGTVEEDLVFPKGHVIISGHFWKRASAAARQPPRVVRRTRCPRALAASS